MKTTVRPYRPFGRALGAAVPLSIVLTILVSLSVDVKAQLPVRTREARLISDNNVNTTTLQAGNGQIVDWTLRFPTTAGSTGSLLTSTTAGSTTDLNWLAPGAQGTILYINAGMPTWSLSMPWLTGGNVGLNDATDFLGTTDAVDLVFRTNNVERLRIESTGEVGLGVTPTAGYQLDVNGTAGTENVRLRSLGAASADALTTEGILTADDNGDLRRRTATDIRTLLGVGSGIFTPGATASTFVIPTGSFDVAVGAVITVTVNGPVGPAVHAQVTAIDDVANTFTIVTSAAITNSYRIHWMAANP